MRRPPDWLVYAAVTAVLLGAALAWRDRHAPPPRDGELLPAASPDDPQVTVEIADGPHVGTGTAFSTDGGGAWLTARHVVDGCRQAALIVSDGRGVEADIRVDPNGDVALLSTQGGTPPLPLALDAPLRKGMAAFHPGFPQGRPGEAASRLIGRETLVVRGHGARREPVLAWAETGRTARLTGTLGGLSGAPALDAQGRVVAVTVAESPRRGRIYTTDPHTVAETLRPGRPSMAPAGGGEPLTADNYGLVAERLRRELRVAQVVCLPA